MLQNGSPFPRFSLLNQDEKLISLSDFAGRWLVLYVYPKDDTPGCTLEGRNFNASLGQFTELNAAVVGLSADDPQSHQAFCGKYQFKFPLLSDPEGKFLKAAGVGQSDYKGTLYWNRTTFLVDPQGVTRKIYSSVNPEGHEKEVLKDLRDFQKH